MLRSAMLVGVLLLGACSRLMGPAPPGSTPIPSYPDGPAGLQAFFDEVLRAARRDERERVHDYLASTRMSKEELRALFGPSSAGLESRYRAMMDTLVHRGALELVAQVFERKYDAVEVIPIDPAGPGATPIDRAIAAALKTPTKLYAVRIKRAAESKGLRYDFFFYRGGRWRTGNLLGKVLAAEAADAGAPP